jgi:superoxide dismutase, Fe-Mn family
MSFKLPTLPYDFNALEPFYDAKTVEIHYSKHHQTYTDKLNEAAEKAGVLDLPIETILTSLESIPADKRTPVRNHAGGYWNHTFFWESMKPGGSKPGEALLAKINATFGSLEAFQQQFSAKALAHFGSGWAWLVENATGALEITDTHDQVCPLSLGQKPLLTIDVWEHAYYLKYQNRRPEWVAAFMNIIDWEKVTARLG